MDRGKVIIDGDIIAYRASFATQDKMVSSAKDKVDELINYVLQQTVDLPFVDVGDYSVYLTGKTNFRFDVAVSYPYKGNRKAVEKPIHLSATRSHMIEHYGAIVSVDEEADDLIAKEAAALDYDCVVASIDKDMLQLPCWHFNFVKGGWTKVSPFEGIKFFYTQILTGDSADNIKGLHRVGPKTADKMLSECKTEVDLWEGVYSAYDGDTVRILENARLLWLRRYDNEVWKPPKGATYER